MENINNKLIINPGINEVYGFLILSSHKYLLGTFSKGKKEIIFKSDINSIKFKNRARGGVTSDRFGRIRKERISKIFNIIEENMKKIFIKNNSLNISGLLIGGNMIVIKKYLSYKRNDELIKDYLYTIIETINDGELGFEEAIKLSMIEN